LVADNPFLQRERTLMPFQGLGRPQPRAMLTLLPMLRVPYSATFVYGISARAKATRCLVPGRLVLEGESVVGPPGGRSDGRWPTDLLCPAEKEV
jgi:hypothetical protein